jgi:L-cysteine:1D-myo-inositol 2-amino-2-deoxy-alpha-D-glucopyranoside ligase
MRSWSRADVPTLPGSGRPLRLYDTATDEIRPSAPGANARIYACGITPYDATHLGHAATYLAFDLMQRVWLDAGPAVHYVQNVTDIDDPLLDRATATGVDWAVLAERETELFRQDMTSLRVLPPTDYVGVVESVGEIADAVAKLLADDKAYRLDSDVYATTTGSGHFGYESRYPVEQMLVLAAERGGDPDRPGKRDPLDAMLWRGKREGEPFWESVVGPGRPGWHVECSVIALSRLGMGIDVQGGGSDLRFPHHEHSAAWIRWRSGWRCWTGTTGPIGSGPAAGCRSRSSGWHGGGPRRRWTVDRTASRFASGFGNGSPTTSTRSRRSPWWTGGPLRRWSSRGTGTRRPPASRLRRRWTRCWGSSSETFAGGNVGRRGG